MSVTWRHTGISPKLAVFDASCFIFLLPFLFHICVETFLLWMVSLIFCWIIERRGITPRIYLSLVRASMVGSIRESMDTRVFRRRCWYS